MHRTKIMAGFMVGLIVGLTLAGAVAGPRQDRQEKLIDEFFNPLVWLVTEVERRYVEDVEPDTLVVGAYQGILSKLDRYSAFIPPERREEFESDTQGEFGGLGISIRYLPVKKAVLIEQTIPNTPAFSAGLLPGDMIIEVVEESTGVKHETESFEDVHDAVRILRGKPGTTVVLTVVHEEQSTIEEIHVTRDIIEIPGVENAHILQQEPRIGYLRVPYFHERTVADLRERMSDLREQGAQGVILDLRFNPGGLLQSAIEFADLFLDGGLIVSTRGRTSPEQKWRARAGDSYPEISLVVLVNRYSASASEIVAAALAENGRAALVGEHTYGKASVQTLINDPNTDGAIKLTTARYHTPNGLLIEGKGVEPDPDRTIELSREDLVALRQSLAAQSDFAPARNDDEAEGQSPEAEFVDEQLARAVEVMGQILAETAPTAPMQAAAGADQS